jgi:hypothetical protein
LKKLKILYTHYGLPDEKFLKLENLENILEKEFELEKICLFYRYEKLDLEKFDNQKQKNLDYHNYADAVELIKEVRPDLIIAGGFLNALISNSVLLAGKFMNIPVVNWLGWPAKFKRTNTEILKNFSIFLQNENSVNKNKPNSSRLSFLFKRYMFLYKTQKKIGLPISSRTKFFLAFFRNISSKSPQFYYIDYNPDLIFASGERLYKNLIQQGFDKNNICITGVPAFDHVFQKINKFQKEKSDKIQVLFVPDTLVEHNFWTKNKRDQIMKGIIKNIIKEKDQFNLTVKINPSMANLQEYQQVVNEVAPEIIVKQKEDYFDLLAKSDIVIDFASWSSSTMYALAAQKPVLFCNPEPPSDDFFLNYNVAMNCKDPKMIIEYIKKAINENLSTSKQSEIWIKDFLFKSDGLASERIVEKIKNILK